MSAVVLHVCNPSFVDTEMGFPGAPLPVCLNEPQASERLFISQQKRWMGSVMCEEWGHPLACTCTPTHASAHTGTHTQWKKNTYGPADTPPIPQAAAVHWSPALLVGVSTQGTLSSRNWIIHISFCYFFLLRCPWGFLFVLFWGRPLLEPRLLGTCNIDQAGLNFQLVVLRPHHPKSWDCRRALPHLACFHFYCHLCFSY